MHCERNGGKVGERKEDTSDKKVKLPKQIVITYKAMMMIKLEIRMA